MAKFPDSPGVEALRRVGSEVFVLPAGTLLWRIYRREGRPGETLRRSWDAFRSYGPLRSARFDHHEEPPPGEEPRESERAIMYAAVGEHERSGAVAGGEAILTCVAEVFQQTRLVDTSAGAPWLAAFEIEGDLPLLDLTGGWPTRAGASMQISSGPRLRARGGMGTQKTKERGTSGQARGKPSTLTGAADTSDFLTLDALLSEEKIETRDRIRAFVEERIKPNIGEWFEKAEFPREIVGEFASLGLFGMHLSGYGCPGKSAVEYGLACMELEAGDSGLRTLVSVQGSLAMSAIHKFGSEEQKNEWLPRMATGESLGCFGLTEPSAGSDPASMETFARKDGSDWIVNGSKRWIGMGTLSDAAVIWARTDEEGNPVRGFLVPTDSPGYEASAITGKLSMRSAVQTDIELTDVRLPESSMLPGAKGLGGPFACLNEARYGIIWGAMGAARDSYEAALAYSMERHQFKRPIASFQLTQKKLVDMMLEIQKGTMVALHIGRMKDAGTLRHDQISFGKLNNVREAIAICREARTILGGNGVTVDYSPLRHANNLESVRTYGGTDEVHTLILGASLTGIPAFK